MSKSGDNHNLEELILETERNRMEIELSLEKAKNLKPPSIQLKRSKIILVRKPANTPISYAI
jgi:hypothetical protein